tara:strand:+ start:2119 stop:3108 length:990 start_codon:yes stop_codon:yes gene_type:complete
MSWFKSSIPYGGIADVATDPEYRNLGLSRKLLDKSLLYMTKASLPLSVLFTRNLSHYEHHGWVSVPTYIIELEVPSIQPSHPEGFEVTAVKPHHIPVLYKLYKHQTARLVGPEIRSEGYMHGQSEWLEAKGAVRWDVINSGGRPVGYVRTRMEGNILHLLDMCSNTIDTDQFALATILQHAASHDCTSVHIAAIPDSHFANTVTSTTDYKIVINPDRMIRINNLGHLFERILPETPHQSKNPSLINPFTLQVADESVHIDPSGHRPKISTQSNSSPIATMSAGTFLNILFGQQNSGPLPSDLEGDPAAINALLRLFPKSGNIMWRADRF